MKNKRKLLIKIFTIIMVVVLGISCFGCEKVRPDNKKEEFKFIDTENSITKHHLYIDLKHDAQFSVPVFANIPYVGEADADLSYAKFISAEGENIEDIELSAGLRRGGGVYRGEKYILYIFDIKATAISSLWDRNAAVRKITSMRFGIYDNETTVPVDISFNMSDSEILCDYHELCNGEKPQYEAYADIDRNRDGKNVWPYHMQMFWNYSAWGSIADSDLDHKAILKAVYFEHNLFQIKDLIFSYCQWNSGDEIKFVIENPSNMNYVLSTSTDKFNFNVQISEENNGYSFLGDNLVFEVEYNGIVHKVIVKNIQLHGREKSLYDLEKSHGIVD